MSVTADNPIGRHLDGSPIFQFRGAERGYSTQGDVLVNATADGVDLDSIWEEFAEVLNLYNSARSAYTELLSFPTTAVAEPVAQAVGSESFDVASEFGLPTAARQPADSLLVGYDFLDYDKATRFTWKFLRDAAEPQVRAQYTRILEADNKNTTGAILQRLFTPTEGVSPEGRRVFGLYTGQDGITPPPYLGREFPSSTNHYLTSLSPVIDSGDVEDMIRMLTIQGFGTALSGRRLVILASEAEAEAIQTWKRGEPNGDAGRATAKHDFIPSASADPYLTTDQIVGQVPAGDYANIKVLGQYGPALLLEPSAFLPTGYLAIVATGGPNSALNPVGFREHRNVAYRGLRMVPGVGPYPLVDSTFARGFGTGIRHRGSAVCLQVTTSPTYTPPVVPR